MTHDACKNGPTLQKPSVHSNYVYDPENPIKITQSNHENPRPGALLTRYDNNTGEIKNNGNFEVIKYDACANRRSVMSILQYAAYCNT